MLSRWKLTVPFFVPGPSGAGIVAIVYCRRDQSAGAVLRHYLTVRKDRRIAYLDFGSLRGSEEIRSKNIPGSLRVWIEGTY